MAFVPKTEQHHHYLFEFHFSLISFEWYWCFNWIIEKTLNQFRKGQWVMSSGINADYADGKKDLNDELKSEPSYWWIKKMVFLLWQWAALVFFSHCRNEIEVFRCLRHIDYGIVDVCVCKVCISHACLIIWITDRIVTITVIFVKWLWKKESNNSFGWKTIAAIVNDSSTPS